MCRSCRSTAYLGSVWTLKTAPCVVPTILDDINLLPRGLTDVGEEEPPIAAIKREPPGIAQPVGPDLPTRAGGPQERIIGWDGIWESPVHVDTQHFAKERAQILPVVLRIPSPAFVAQSNVQVPVGAEQVLATVVIRIKVGDFQQYPLASISNVEVSG